MTISAFSDELAQVRTKKKEFLTQIERIVPWKEWLALIQPCYYKGERGNKPYPLETMLRLYLLQNLYDLSDEATVAETINSRAFSDFCGVDSSNQVPDGDTLGRFRNLLLKNGLQEKLFAQVVAMLMERGLILKKGTISVVGIANLLCPGQTGTVPARASFEVAICSYDEEELRALSDEAVQTVETTCAEQGAQCTSERSCVAPAYRIPADAPLLRRVCRGLTELGYAPAIGQPLRCSDAAWLAEGGRTAIEIGVGVQNAHSCGEHILFEDIALTTELLLKLLTE